MKKRLYTLSLIIVSIFLGAILFQTSQAVQTEEAHQRRLRDAVAGERETIRVLGAEWAYLTRPDRLENLARAHLRMVAPDSAQLAATLSDLPSPLPAPAVPGRKPEMAAQAAVYSAPARPAAEDRPPVQDNGNFRNLLENLSGTEEGGR